MLVVTIVERLVVMAPPGLEVVCTADILLHLLLTVQFGLHHLRLVDNVGGKALAIKWAATNLLEQLQVLVSGASSTGMGGLMLAKTFLLWAEMICFMFGQVE